MPSPRSNDLPAKAADLAPVNTERRTALLRWYDAHSRDLPWRHAGDPYAVWVSEIMLQQTRVETVRGYFERWMARFPTPEALAASSVDDVLQAWQGLGYYSRARNLHRAAQAYVALEEKPVGADAWRALPGIGPYTAGAIASIAFGEEAPLVDGNVMRVFSRWFGIADDIGKGRTQRLFWAIAAQWVAGPRPGDFNQALMELGATVCTPRGARCARCPLEGTCVARREGRVNALPVKAKKAKQRPETRVAFAVEHEGRRLWARRAAEGLLGGLWELPSVRVEGDVDSAAVARAWREAGGAPLTAEGARLESSSERAAGEPVRRAWTVLAPVSHVFSHIRLHAYPALARATAEQAPRALDGFDALAWFGREEAEALAQSKLARKLSAAVDGGQLALS